MSDAKAELGKLAADLHKRHHTVEDVRDAFVAGVWYGEAMVEFEGGDIPEKEAIAEALRRWPDKEDSHDK
jgi:hypothetical protein